MYIKKCFIRDFSECTIYIRSQVCLVLKESKNEIWQGSPEILNKMLYGHSTSVVSCYISLLCSVSICHGGNILVKARWQLLGRSHGGNFWSKPRWQLLVEAKVATSWSKPWWQLLVEARMATLSKSHYNKYKQTKILETDSLFFI